MHREISRFKNFIEYHEAINEAMPNGTPSRIMTGFRIGNTTFYPGNLYVFNYKNYVTPNYVPDRPPGSPVTYLHMYAFNEINKNTGHPWKLIEGICLDYVELNEVKKFMKRWADIIRYSRGKAAYYTWEMAKTSPMKEGIRRYVYDPPNAHMYNINFVDWDKIPQFMANYTHS